MATDEIKVGADTLPAGDYAICEFFGHQTLVGRIEEIERFGSKMLALEPLFNGHLLPPVFNGGASIYRLTPCSAVVAWARQPKDLYQLPQAIAWTVPATALPAEQMPLDLDADDYHEREEEWIDRHYEGDES